MPLSSATVDPVDASVISYWSHDCAFRGQKVKAAFDNLVLNSGTTTPQTWRAVSCAVPERHGHILDQRVEDPSLLGYDGKGTPSNSKLEEESQ